MSKSGNQSIENAVEIIEKFGGIRPMSAKVNVAVTTIQGWKKRNTIPGTRRKVILEAAASHNIDLSEFLEDARPVSNEVGEPEAPKEEVETESASHDDKADIVEIATIQPSVQPEKPAQSNENVRVASSGRATSGGHEYTEISMSSKRSNSAAKSASIAALIVIGLIAVVAAMLWPDFNDRGERIASLEGDISEIKEQQSAFKGLVPENWVEQLEDLKDQAAQAKQTVDETVENVQVASQQFAEEHQLEERVVRLQTYVSEIADETGIYGLLSRFEGMEESEEGQDVLDDSVLELTSLLAEAEGKDDSHINGVLDSARAQSAALKKTLGDVPKNELKAATMLLALTQVRSALNRSDEAFESDLKLLMNMVDKEDTELQDALTKLSPHSKSGVLSANGLQQEFRTLAGDVVAASLSGEDVSFSEKASARMNDILQIEKDGELVTGTETQAKLKKADTMIKYGNWEQAVRYLKSHLNDEELKPLRPFFRHVEAVLAKKKVQRAVKNAILCILNGTPEYCRKKAYR